MLKPSTIKAQEALAMFTRTGEYNTIPGVLEHRLTHYRRLVHNVTYGILKQAFPITLQLLSQKEWDELVNAFQAQHDAQAEEVWRMPKELHTFVQQNDYNTTFNRPYLEELLWFEWLEIEVYGMLDGFVPNFTKGNLSEQELILNPDFHLHSFSHPFHKMSIEAATEHVGLFHVLVYRTQTTKEVRFIELSPFTQLLFELLLETQSFHEALRRVEIETGLSLDENQRNGALQFVTHLYDKEVILGVSSPE